MDVAAHDVRILLSTLPFFGFGSSMVYTIYPAVGKLERMGFAGVSFRIISDFQQVVSFVLIGILAGRRVSVVLVFR